MLDLAVGNVLLDIDVLLFVRGLLLNVRHCERAGREIHCLRVPLEQLDHIVQDEILDDVDIFWKRFCESLEVLRRTLFPELFDQSGERNYCQYRRCAVTYV